MNLPELLYSMVSKPESARKLKLEELLALEEHIMGPVEKVIGDSSTFIKNVFDKASFGIVLAGEINGLGMYGIRCSDINFDIAINIVAYIKFTHSSPLAELVTLPHIFDVIIIIQKHIDLERLLSFYVNECTSKIYVEFILRGQVQYENFVTACNYYNSIDLCLSDSYQIELLHKLVDDLQANIEYNALFILLELLDPKIKRVRQNRALEEVVEKISSIILPPVKKA